VLLCSGSGAISAGERDPGRTSQVSTGAEEKARAREADPARNALGPVRELMGEVFDGAPTFTDFDVAALRSY
jgi:hypothetical protein